MKVCTLTAILVTLGWPSVAAPGPPPMPPPDASELERIFATPPGSLSFGGTGGGRLERGEEIPLSGRGWAFIPVVRARHTNHGTREMAGLLRRVAARVADAHPGARLGIGNVSLPTGGRSRWHASHQAGRDVDILMFARDRRDRATNPTRFLGFDADGRSRDGRYRFDVERNLTLVEALVTDPQVGVQWIFVSDGLKALLLEAATARGLPAATVERLGEVLHQPTDALPHDDHFHVRLYCSPEDRRYGCLDFAPFWPWVERGDEAFSARVATLLRVLEVPDEQVRLRGIRALADLRAIDAVPSLVSALYDDSEPVREASLRAIRVIGSPSALGGLLDALGRTDDPAWAARLFSAAVTLPTDAVLEVARTYLKTPARYLSDPVAKADPTPLLTATARVLGRYGRPEVVPELLELLTAPRAETREAARDALISVTNRAPDAPSPSTARKAERARAVWTRLWDRHKAASWHEWLRGGFEAAGYRLRGSLSDPRSIEVLIEATGDSRSYISENAVRLLSEVTGHAVDPRSRPPSRQQRHWRYWWEHNAP
ncbi:MAG: penicillin-insensitive murein endopeptidase [Deltaproteobacteria bacterium]|nr:penicillin-insensitive murein endopeptidase [Deltaproteobacteria bacterium]